MNKKTIIMSLLFVSLIIGVTFAEGSEYIDVVYLKNGSIIKGIIVENVPDSTIKLETADGSIMVFAYKDLLKFAKEKKLEPVKNESKVDSATENYMKIIPLLSNIKANSYEIQNLGKGLKPDQRMMLIQEAESKNSPAIPFVVNLLVGCFFIGGIGSFIQGDARDGFISLIGEGGGFVLYVTAQDAGAASVGGILVLGGWIYGLVCPWVYASNQNSEISRLLSSSYGPSTFSSMDQIPFHNKKSSLQVTIPIMTLQF